MTEPVASRSRRSEKRSMRVSVSPARTGCSVLRPGPIHKGTPSGETIYLGSPHSQTLLRIYDKRLERQAKEQKDWQDYGIRWELELKKDRAQVCGQALSFLEQADWLDFTV